MARMSFAVAVMRSTWSPQAASWANARWTRSTVWRGSAAPDSARELLTLPDCGQRPDVRHGAAPQSRQVVATLEHRDEAPLRMACRHRHELAGYPLIIG